MTPPFVWSTRFVLLTVALAACTIEVPNPASVTASAPASVSKAPSAGPGASTTSPPPPSPTGSTTTPPPPTPDTCATLAHATPQGQFSIDPPINTVNAPVDVYAVESEVLPPQPGQREHRYDLALVFSTTPSACAYRKIGAMRTKETMYSYGVSRVSNEPLDEPFPLGVYAGSDGSGMGMECTADGGGGGGTDLGYIDITITITYRDAAVVEGTFLVTDQQNPSVIVHKGTFRAPFCTAAPQSASTQCCLGG